MTLTHRPRTKRARQRPEAPVQLELPAPRTWGGKRKGAGRPRSGRVAHVPRPRVTRHTPVHVTMRLRDGLPSLRRHRIYRVVQGALREVCEWPDFRVCEYSVQGNHIHAICEADDVAALAHGVHALETRIARRINRALGRSGRVLADRYHSRPLRSPTEVRLALRYVLLNGRRHAAARGNRIGPDWFDPFSSAAWFTGWKEPLPWREPWMRELRAGRPPRAEPQSWLLTEGWKRKDGPISLRDTPGPADAPDTPRPPAAAAAASRGETTRRSARR